MKRRRLGTPPPPPRSAGSPGGGSADRISALGDDLLLLILGHLGSAAAAARSSLLSRRWRGLWTRVPSLVFTDVVPGSLDSALARVSMAGSAVSLLDIRLPERSFSTGLGVGPAPCGSVSSLLRSAARLSPEQLVLAIPCAATALYFGVVLPGGFARTTSISLSAASPMVLRAAGVFPALTTLVLSGCVVHCLPALVPRCRSLRVLRFAGPASYVPHGPLGITVHSASLRELVLEESLPVGHVAIVTPMLEQLTVSISAHDDDLRVLVQAPKADKVSWRCGYSGGEPTRFGYLEMVSLLSTLPMLHSAAADQRRCPCVLLRVNALTRKYLSLDWFAPDSSGKQDHVMMREVEKLLRLRVAADFSVLDLELHLAPFRPATPFRHVYEALVFFFLNMQLIRTAIRRLKVILPQPADNKACRKKCGCVPKGWTRPIMTLAELEEVEIDGFQGLDHEFDFLEHLFRCAPMLIRVTLKQSSVVAPSDAKIHDFFKAYPWVECYYVLSP